MYSAVSSAWLLSSNAISQNPMVYAFRGFAIAVIKPESIPPERNAPTGTSLSRCAFTESLITVKRLFDTLFAFVFSFCHVTCDQKKE